MAGREGCVQGLDITSLFASLAFLDFFFFPKKLIKKKAITKLNYAPPALTAGTGGTRQQPAAAAGQSQAMWQGRRSTPVRHSTFTHACQPECSWSHQQGLFWARQHRRGAGRCPGTAGFSPCLTSGRWCLWCRGAVGAAGLAGRQQRQLSRKAIYAGRWPGLEVATAHAKRQASVHQPMCPSAGHLHSRGTPLPLQLAARSHHSRCRGVWAPPRPNAPAARCDPTGCTGKGGQRGWRCKGTAWENCTQLSTLGKTPPLLHHFQPSLPLTELLLSGFVLIRI